MKHVKSRLLNAKEIFSRSQPAVVQIRSSIYKNGRRVQFSGSGFFFSRPDMVATAYHVIDKAEAIEILDSKGTHFQATAIACDVQSDVAILRLQRPSNRKPLLPTLFANIKVGDTAFTIGNPLGLMPDTISQGIVSGKRKLQGTPFIQVTASISEGNSGGPILNDKGRVMGLVSFYLTKGQNINLGAASNGLVRLLTTDSAWIDLPSYLSVNADSKLRDATRLLLPTSNERDHRPNPIKTEFRPMADLFEELARADMALEYRWDLDANEMRRAADRFASYLDGFLELHDDLFDKLSSKAEELAKLRRSLTSVRNVMGDYAAGAKRWSEVTMLGLGGGETVRNLPVEESRLIQAMMDLDMHVIRSNGWETLYPLLSSPTNYYFHCTLALESGAKYEKNELVPDFDFPERCVVGNYILSQEDQEAADREREIAWTQWQSRNSTSLAPGNLRYRLWHATVRRGDVIKAIRANASDKWQNIKDWQELAVALDKRSNHSLTLTKQRAEISIVRYGEERAVQVEF